jgi:molecular chaperone DnaK
VLPNAFGERTTASVVAFAEDGSINVGNQAKARIILDPRNTVSSAKRLIGRYFFSEEARKARAIAQYDIVEGPRNSVRIKVREREYSLPEISAFVLKEMREVAEHALGCEVRSSVITVPAYFNDNQRQATKDAGRIAGLEVLRILNEPTAAALAYGYGRDLEQRVAVYDLGGGTFDVSVLEIGKDLFEVLSTCGDTFLGGDDFDDRIIDLLAEEFQREHGLNARNDPFAFERLKVAAEEAKIGLSIEESVRVRIPGLITDGDRALGIDREITRGEFNRLVNDLIQRTFKVCDEALQQAGVTCRDLDGVILVGGSTRLPTIRWSVAEYFGKEPNQDINPDEVVAIGAGIHASSLVSTTKSTYLLDVTPLSLRLGIAGGLTETIIHRNTPIPIEATRAFTTARDYQESIDVKIYQGESRAAEGNALLGEFSFSGYAPSVRGDVQIEVTFAISTEGIVQVAARDPASGAERSTEVKMTSGLSEDEIQEIIARSQAEGAGSSQPREEAEDHAPVPIQEEEEFIEESHSPPPFVEPQPSGERDELFGIIDGELATPDED